MSFFNKACGSCLLDTKNDFVVYLGAHALVLSLLLAQSQGSWESPSSPR